MTGPNRYGLWVMGELWVMGPISPQTKSVTQKMYGLWGGMGYESYGLGGIRLYAHYGSR